MAKKKETGKPPEKMKFEEAMEELEQIVEQMEEGGLTLDESIEKFERGMRLSQVCSRQLQKAELKVEKLARASSGELEVSQYDEEQTAESNEQQDERSEQTGEEGLLF